MLQLDSTTQQQQDSGTAAAPGQIRCRCGPAVDGRGAMHGCEGFRTQQGLIGIGEF